MRYILFVLPLLAACTGPVERVGDARELITENREAIDKERLDAVVPLFCGSGLAEHIRRNAIDPRHGQAAALLCGPSAEAMVNSDAPAE